MAHALARRSQSSDTPLRDDTAATANDNFPSISANVWGDNKRDQAIATKSMDHRSADEHHRRGLELAEQGIRLERRELLEQARDAFEAALNAVPDEPATVAFRRREEINLSIILRRLGQPNQAIERLKNIPIDQPTAKPSPRSLDDARLLDSLASAYSDTGQHSEAVQTYKRAIETLGNTDAPHRQDHAQLRYRICDNLAWLLINEGRAEEAFDFGSQASKFVERDSDPLGWARTQHVLGEALCTQAEQQDDPYKVSDVLEKADACLEACRPALWRHAPKSEWRRATETLASVRRTLGGLRMQFGATDDNEARRGIGDIRSAAALYIEEWPELQTENERRALRKHLINTLQRLKASSESPEDKRFIYASVAQFNQLVTIPLNGLIIEPSLLWDVTDHDRIDAALDGLIASWKVSEDEATRLLAEACQRRGWAANITTTPQGEHSTLTLPEKAPKLYADRPKGQNIIDFLRDPEGWGPYVTKGLLSRPDFRRFDPQGEMALQNWLRDSNHQLPNEMHIPTKSEAINLMLKMGQVPAPLIPRFGQTLAKRRQRQRRP